MFDPIILPEKLFKRFVSQDLIIIGESGHFVFSVNISELAGRLVGHEENIKQGTTKQIQLSFSEQELELIQESLDKKLYALELQLSDEGDFLDSPINPEIDNIKDLQGKIANSQE